MKSREDTRRSVSWLIPVYGRLGPLPGRLSDTRVTFGWQVGLFEL